ncbi:MAG TPA: TIGR04076 family protein [Anaerolineae bacterium]|nr:TIGR04076 family protein [Anaerolineae bacterium]
MSSKEPRCRITVLKRTLNQDLVDEYMDEAHKPLAPCDQFSDGQQFLLEGYEGLSAIPEGFCPWAWADIRHDLLRVMSGGDTPGVKQPGTTMTGCTDWFRPVIFKIQRVKGD